MHLGDKSSEMRDESFNIRHSLLTLELHKKETMISDVNILKRIYFRRLVICLNLERS